MARERLLPLFFAAVYLSQGLVGIAYEPISFLLKDVLRLSPAESAAFTAVMTAPFLLKPLWGALSDALPFGRRRRLPYLLASASAAVLGWAALASRGSYSYRSTLLLLTLVNLGTAFSDVLCDAVMVERGKLHGRTGTYQAIQIGTLYATLFAAGLGGGWLAQHASYQAVFGLAACVPLLVLASAFLVRESPAEGPARQARAAAGALGSLLRERRFWAACAFILLFNFSPFLGTSFFYHQSEALGFSKVFIGTLASLDGLCGALGALLFARLYGRLDARTLVRASVVVGPLATLAYWAYRGPVSGFVVTALYGLAVVLTRLSLMDLLARVCPEGAEATAFAAFMAVFNLAALSSNTVGGALYSAWAPVLGPHAAMAALVAIGAACAASCRLLLRPLGVA